MTVDSTNNGSLAEALAKAQAEFGTISRSKTVLVRMKSGGQYKFSYAPLEAILRATMPALNKYGFGLVQAIENDSVVTHLHHAAGSYSNTVKIMVVDSGPQAYGSAITYARRYGVTLLLGVCADDDDDGNAAEGNEAEEQERTAHDAKRELEAKLLASSFKVAHDNKSDEEISKVHDLANRDQELYQMAWKLLDAPTRREIKHSIDRIKHPNGKHQ